MVITCDVGFGVLGEWRGGRFVHASVLPKELSALKFIVQWVRLKRAAGCPLRA